MGLTMLVADDSSTIQKVIKIALAKYAVQIIEAGSFIEALGATGRDQYDMLIVDASLPGARGPNDFKKMADQAGGVPMLLLVGSYENVDENSFRAAGLKGFVKKPFESRDIIDRVDELLDGRLKQGTGEPAPKAKTLSNEAPSPPSPQPPDLTQSPQHVATSAPAEGGPPDTSHAVPPPPPLRREASSGGMSLPEKPPTTSAHADAQKGEDEAAPEDDTGLTDMTRKGQPAFGEQPTAPTSLPEKDLSGSDSPDQDFERDPTPPPVSFGTSTQAIHRPPPAEEGSSSGGSGDQKRHATTTYIPPSMGLDEWDQMQADRGTPKDSFASSATAETNPRSTGMPSSLPEEPPAPVATPAPEQEETEPPAMDSRFRDHPLHNPLPSEHQFDGSAATSTSPSAEALDFQKLRATLGDFVEAQLPELVHGAVENYLAVHFKEIAKEVLTQEIRRLADEKARHLVDN